MNAVWGITEIGIKENLRNKAVYFIFIVTLFFILLGRGCDLIKLTPVSSNVEESYQYQISLQAAFHFIIFWSITLCSLLSMASLTREIDQGTITQVLARPVSRFSFALGKFFSVIIIAYANLFILSGIFFLLFYTRSGVPNFNLFLCSFLMTLSLALIAVINFLSSLLAPRLAVPIISLIIYVLSLWMELPFFYEDVRRVWQPSSTAKLFNTLLPRFGELQYLTASILGSERNFEGLLLPILDMLLFIGICWIVMIFIFNRREI